MAVQLNRELGLRVATSFVLAPFALYLVYLGGMPFDLLVFCILALGAREWIKLTAPKPAPLRLTLVSVSALMVMLYFIEHANPLAELAVVGLSLPVLYVLARWTSCEKPLVTAIGTSYLGLSLLCLWWLRGPAQDSHARDLLLFLLFSVWAVDTGAYFAGRTFGGPKLAPKYSPNKTWSGLIGGALVATAVGYGWAVYAKAVIPALALLLCPLIAIVAQIGDIMESALKRRFDAKDSGRLIPGHGGILDRIDGLLLATPVFALFQLLVGQQLGWW